MAHLKHSGSRKSNARSGLAALELAILAPFLACLFVVAVDFSRIFYFSITVTNCARNGAIFGAQNSTNAANTAGITTAAQKDAGNLTLSQMNVSSTYSSSTNPAYVTVTVTYPFSTLTNYPGIPTSITLSRTVRMNVSPLVIN